MGSWGPGALQNDHAQDLLSIELDRWREALATDLGSATSWDDIEGLLVYVHLLVTLSPHPGELGLLARPPERGVSSADIARQWKEKFLALEEQKPFRDDGARSGRLAEVRRLFDALIAASVATDAPAAPAKKKAPAGTSRKKKA